MSSLDSFIVELFSQSPKPRDSVRLTIHTGGDVPALFEVFLTIFTEGMKKLHDSPPPITISRFSSDTIQKLAAYFASFGVMLSIDKSPKETGWKKDNNSYLNESNLEDMKFQMSDGPYVYTVSFSFF